MHAGGSHWLLRKSMRIRTRASKPVREQKKRQTCELIRDTASPEETINEAPTLGQGERSDHVVLRADRVARASSPLGLSRHAPHSTKPSAKTRRSGQSAHNHVPEKVLTSSAARSSESELGNFYRSGVPKPALIATKQGSAITGRAYLFDLYEEKMVLLERFELSASPLPRECSTPEL